MIPLRDNIPSRRKPVVSLFLLFSCLIIFAIQRLEQTLLGSARFTQALGFKSDFLLAWWDQIDVALQTDVAGPGERVVSVIEHGVPGFIESALPLISYQFLHGGVGHLLFNLLFLWIFADNIECDFGHRGFFVFYLLCGVAAAMTHLWLTDGGDLLIGASGSIAGVLGAYFVRFPKAKVLTLFPLGWIPILFEIPALIFLGIWFVLQLIPGILGSGGQVAVWAHIGGFVAGAAIAAIIPRARARSRGPGPRYAKLERTR